MEVAAGGSALDALRAFATASCPQNERNAEDNCNADTLTLAATPPPAHEEFSHELASGFLFSEEMKVVRQLQAKCTEGQQLVNAIYCSRSCARAFPAVVVTDATNPARSKQYYHAIFTVLQPQVAKIKQLSEYCSQAVVLLSDNIQRTTVHENMTRAIPDIMMDALLDIMDVIIQLNHLHDTKSSLRNDFSVFKRTFLHIKDDLPDAEFIEKDIVRLQEFVGSSSQSKGAIWDSLRHNLTNVKRFDQVTYLLLKHCIDHIEHDRCATPHRTFKYIRTLSYLLAILQEADGGKKTGTLPGADKKVIEAAVKLLGRFPVVPMLAEISLKPVRSLPSQSGHKAESTSGITSSKHRDALLDIVAVSRESKATSERYLPQLMLALNTDLDHPYTQSQNAELYRTLVDGIEHLNVWKSSFSLFLAFKYQTPRPNEKLREASVRMDSPFLEYELVTKHNYSDEEWQAMADIIYSVKSVVQILRQFRLKLVACVRRSVYQQIQVFVQHTLLPILHRADKRKLACTKLLHDIRMMCGDWVDCDVLLNDFKKKRKERRFPEFRDRTASPSICQIQMLRTAVDSIYAKRSMGDLNAKSSASSTLFSFKKDLESSDIDSLQLFYREAGAFPALLDLSATLSELGDFSSVWFRELYLELAKSVQIPTEISLPWLLIEHCLDRVCSSIAQIEPVLSILDIYNDAANCSLYDLRQQWLYDEVESEGKLCFDHFVFLLAERVYLHYKLTATRDAVRRLGFCNGLAGSSRSNTISMAAKLTSCSLSPDQSAHTTSGDAKYVHILTQKQVNIFGRTYNLRFHLGQRINALLRKDVEAWVTKLETSDVTCYVAVLNLLLILKKTHASLSDLVLDEFDDLVREANDEMVECLSRSSSPSGVSDRTRVHNQISRSVLTDLCQHFSLQFSCRRFVRMPLHMALTLTAGDQFAHEDCLRKAKHRRFSRGSVSRNVASNRLATEAIKYGVLEKSIARGYRAFFSEPHIDALLELLPERALLEVADDCIEFAVVKIEDVLALCIPALGSAIPPFRLPRFMYRTEGCYGFFEGKFKHLLDSDELEAQVFHCFREIGNALMFLLLLGSVMDSRAIQAKGTGDSIHTDGEGRPTERSLQIFQCALSRIAAMLHSSGIAHEWEAGPQSQPENMPNASSFYHVWCALEFLSCNRPLVGDTVGAQAPIISLREMFGDGVQFAGCTLVHLLGQRTLYELWNVSQHVLNVHHHEQVKAAGDAQVAFTSSSKKGRRKGESSGTQTSVGTLDKDMEDKAARFVVSAHEMRATTKRIFHTLETAWPSASRPTTTFTPPSFATSTRSQAPPL